MAAKRKARQPSNGEVVTRDNLAAELPARDVKRLIAIAERYEGPLPKASEFAAYETVHKGSADRIIKMAEKALDGEIYATKADKLIELISVLLSRLFLYALLLSAVYLVLRDKPFEAFLVGLAPIISVIYGTFKKSEPATGDQTADEDEAA